MDGIELSMAERSGNLQVIYEQCNEHLREGDRKRDQIVGVFTVLLGGFIAGSDKILEGFENQVILLIILHSVFFIGGYFLTGVLIKYRLWHVQYNIAAQVIQKLMFTSQPTITKEDINRLLKDSFNESPTIGNVLLKTESRILNVFSVINFINVIYILYTIHYVCYGSINVLEYIIISVIFLVIYGLIVNIKNYRSILKFYNLVQEQKAFIWILDLCEGIQNK